MKLLKKFPQIGFKGDYIGGKFRSHTDPDFTFEGKSPAAKSDLIGTIACSYSSADEAVAAALKARDAWAITPWEKRKQAILNFREKIAAHSAAFAELISREVGKPRWESMVEVNAMLARVDFYVQEFDGGGPEFQVEHPIQERGKQNHSLGYCRTKPRGIALVLSHFNSPGDNAMSYIVPAMVSGNTIIYKPSKKAPGVGQLLAECAHGAEFPPGVFNMVQGGREMAKRLAQNPEIDTIFFAGDFEFAKQIRRDTLEHNEKLLAFETGGKNPAIVLEDADMDTAIREVLIGAYATTGQRAESTSRLILQESIAEEFLTRFHKCAKKIVVGNPFNEVHQPFMGPLVDKKTLDRYLTFQGMAVREQAECIMRGKALTLDSDGFYVSPSIYLFKSADPQKIMSSVYLQSEIFGPSLGVHVVKDAEEAVQVANASNYALACSVFTSSEEKFRSMWQLLRYGIIHWNEGTVRRALNLPLAGIKRSSKASPFVRSLTSFVNYPVSSIETSDPALEKLELPPGIEI